MEIFCIVWECSWIVSLILFFIWVWPSVVFFRFSLLFWPNFNWNLFTLSMNYRESLNKSLKNFICFSISPEICFEGLSGQFTHNSFEYFIIMTQFQWISTKQNMTHYQSPLSSPLWRHCYKILPLKLFYFLFVEFKRKFQTVPKTIITKSVILETNYCAFLNFKARAKSIKKSIKLTNVIQWKWVFY
jgi:hypothetical protein